MPSTHNPSFVDATQHVRSPHCYTEKLVCDTSLLHVLFPNNEVFFLTRMGFPITRTLKR